MAPQRLVIVINRPPRFRPGSDLNGCEEASDCFVGPAALSRNSRNILCKMAALSNAASASSPTEAQLPFALYVATSTAALSQLRQAQLVLRCYTFALSLSLFLSLYLYLND